MIKQQRTPSSVTKKLIRLTPPSLWAKMATASSAINTRAFSWMKRCGFIWNALDYRVVSQITRFMGPTWDPPGSCRPQMGPMLAPWTLLLGVSHQWWINISFDSGLVLARYYQEKWWFGSLTPICVTSICVARERRVKDPSKQTRTYKNSKGQ